MSAIGNTAGVLGVSVATASTMFVSNAFAAAAPMPASMEEMWKIIQQQQREIEALKKKVADTGSAPVAAAPAPSGAAPQTPATTAQGDGATAPPRKTAKTDQERKTDILATEVEKLKTQLNIPDKREYKSMYGMGPAASQVYMVKRGLSIGGYGEYFYSNFMNKNGTDEKDRNDFARLVLYAGYKFNDWIVLNSEIEFEHATTGEGAEERGEVSVEFSQLDFLLHPAANIRTGLMLVPMGFINEIHEPLFFHGNNRPAVEQYIIPTTWREMGAGLHGEILPGLTYRMYGINSIKAGTTADTGFTSAGIREARQGGSAAIAEDWAYTGRFDYAPQEVPGLVVGASTFMGNAGQGDVFDGRRPAVFTQLYEGHLQWHYRGLELRALGAWGHIGDAALVSAQKGETIGSSNYGWYAEAAYDVVPLIWPTSTQFFAPFFRFERFDTIATAPRGFQDNGFWDRTIYQVGLTYKPHPNIVVKADYRNIGVRSGAVPNDFNLGVGFIY
ncbi:MAG: hypothetical protein U1E83_11415 [Methylotetracoccus sp.]